MANGTPSARNTGAPEGTTECFERKIRTIYPDGTIVDSEPQSVSSIGQAMTWAKVADMFASIQKPQGTITREFTRRVVTVAEPWVEVPSEVETTEKD
jgi:hypothetical protein